MLYLPWHRLAEVLGPSLGRAGQRAATGPPYTLVRSARDLAEAVLRIEPPSVVAVDTEGDGVTLLMQPMQVAAANKRGGIHTLMAWADDMEAYTALRELVRGCHRVYVWAAKSDGMAGLGYGDVRNAKLVDLQAHYEPDLVRPSMGDVRPARLGAAGTCERWSRPGPDVGCHDRGGDGGGRCERRHARTDSPSDNDNGKQRVDRDP